jgi:hypothetical protein
LRVEDEITLLGEALPERRDRHFRRLFAFGMPAHSVDDDEQRALVPREYVDAVLIVLSVPRKTELRKLHAHGDVRSLVVVSCSGGAPGRDCDRTHVPIPRNTTRNRHTADARDVLKAAPVGSAPRTALRRAAEPCC